jgi:uncharacterized membrane protein SpoIIM required for sporulation
MELVILGFFTAMGKLLVLHKLFTLSKVLYFEKWVDLFFTICLPILFMGTFSGAVLAVFSGLWLSGFLRIFAWFITPQQPHWHCRIFGSKPPTP